MDIEEPWGLSKEALLIYFAVGLLTFRKAPPWIARYLLISFGFKLVRYLLPVLDFVLPDVYVPALRKHKYNLSSRYQNYQGSTHRFFYTYK
jgi:hypothetical protein